jgi:bacterioferritin
MRWMREQALESSATPPTQAGEEVTTLGGDVSLDIGGLVRSALVRSMKCCGKCSYTRARRSMRTASSSRSPRGNLSLEEFARQMIRTEELDVAEIEKMLRKPGDARLAAAAAPAGAAGAAAG